MRGDDIMGKITGICISEKRGVQKHFIEEANIIADWGIEGDAHGGKWASSDQSSFPRKS